jgi:hypothetical protein
VYSLAYKSTNAETSIGTPLLCFICFTVCDADGSRHIGQRCSTFELVSEASDAIHTTIKKQDFPYSFWLRDDSLEESANLPSPDVLGQLS